MRVSAAFLAEVMDQIDALKGVDELSRLQIKETICKIGISEGVKRVSLKAERIEFSIRLLDAKVSRSTIRDRLMAAYSISKSHAYRIIDSALTHRPIYHQQMGRESGLLKSEMEAVKNDQRTDAAQHSKAEDDRRDVDVA